MKKIFLLFLLMVPGLHASEDDYIAWEKITLDGNSSKIGKKLKVIATQNKKCIFDQLDIIFGNKVYVLDKKALSFFNDYPLSSIKLTYSKDSITHGNIYISIRFERVFYSKGKTQRFERIAVFDASGKRGFTLWKKHNGTFIRNVKKTKIKPITLEKYQSLKDQK